MAICKLCEKSFDELQMSNIDKRLVFDKTGACETCQEGQGDKTVLEKKSILQLVHAHLDGSLYKMKKSDVRVMGGYAKIDLGRVFNKCNLVLLFAGEPKFEDVFVGSPPRAVTDIGCFAQLVMVVDGEEVDMTDDVWQYALSAQFIGHADEVLSKIRKEHKNKPEGAQAFDWEAGLWIVSGPAGSDTRHYDWWLKRSFNSELMESSAKAKYNAEYNLCQPKAADKQEVPCTCPKDYAVVVDTMPHELEDLDILFMYCTNCNSSWREV